MRPGLVLNDDRERIKSLPAKVLLVTVALFEYLHFCRLTVETVALSVCTSNEAVGRQKETAVKGLTERIASNGILCASDV